MILSWGSILLHGHLVFPTPICWKDCLFSIEWSWHSCQKSCDHVYKGLSLKFLFCIIGLFVCLYAIPHCFYYCSFVSFVVTWKLGNMSPPALFFLKIVLDIWGPLKFHMNFRIDFSIYAKKCHWDFFIRIALNL